MVATWVVAAAITGQAPAWASEPAGEGVPLSPTALHRLEVRPDVGWAVVPNSLTGGFVGADATFRTHARLAFGLDAAWYAPFDSAPPSNHAYPVNEASWSASLDVSFFPWVARSAGDVEPGTFEAFVLLGLGVVATRPVSVVDPAHRRFADNNEAQLGAGIGARMYLSRSLALTMELRDHLYFEKFENAQVAPGSASLPIQDPNSPSNPATWYSPATRFTQCLELRLGASFFLL